MNIFIKKFIIFVFPILAIGIIFEIFLREIPNDYSYKKEYLDGNSKHVKALFLGSSSIYFGINPEYFYFNSFNAAHVSQPLSFDLEILKKYNHNWDSLEFIVIPIDYTALYFALNNSIDAWRIKNYVIYYDIKTPHKIEYNTEIFSKSFKYNVDRLYRYFFQHESDITCSKLGWGANYNSKNHGDLILTGKATGIRHFEMANNNQYFSENINTIKAIIEFAKTNHSTVIFLTPPAYITYLKYLDANKLRETINTVTEIANSYNNVTYINLLYDSSFTESDFYDSNHLNEIGAQKLSLKINAMLSTINKNIND